MGGNPKNAVSVRGGSRHLFPHGGGRDHEGRPSGMVPVRPCLYALNAAVSIIPLRLVTGC